MLQPHDARAVDADLVPLAGVLPDGVAGIDAGMTLTKVVRRGGSSVHIDVRETARIEASNVETLLPHGLPAGLTGARATSLSSLPEAVPVQEIEAASRGVAALLETTGRIGDGAFLLALMGTGTAFAAVRQGRTAHLGGAAIGGGSFAAITRRIHPGISHHEMLAMAARGDRRRVDMMLGDIYPEGLGRLGPNPELTAAHLSKATADSDLADFFAGLLNMHGESIGQIASQRATAAGVRRVVLAGGFIHGNDALARSVIGMCALFGLEAEVSPAAGYAGAAGAALLAAQGQ